MLRLIGAITIIFSCGLAGIIMAKSYVLRPKYLRELSSAFQLLATEINFSRTTLPEACLAIAAQTHEPVSAFFLEFGNSLKANSNDNASVLWNDSLQVLADAGLIKEDIEALKQLGTVLGRSDAEDQLKHIAILQERLELLNKEADLEKDKNFRLWNYLGFCVGILVVLLLI